jgi:hypothetical protein
MPRAPADLLADVTAAAARHGAQSDPDHEVGDLLDALALAWDLLSDAQRAEAHRRYFATHERWEP